MMQLIIERFVAVMQDSCSVQSDGKREISICRFSVFSPGFQKEATLSYFLHNEWSLWEERGTIHFLLLWHSSLTMEETSILPQYNNNLNISQFHFSWIIFIPIGYLWPNKSQEEFALKIIFTLTQNNQLDKGFFINMCIMGKSYFLVLCWYSYFNVQAMARYCAFSPIFFSH